MGDSSSASDSENAILTNANNLTINSCHAATQTPELPRHAITTQTSVVPIPSSRKSSYADTTSLEGFSSQAPSVVVLRVDKGFTEDFEKEVKALSIPDVVVEYIKDTCALTENTEFKNEESGVVNLGFENIDGLIKCASSTNLKQLGQGEAIDFDTRDLRKCYSMPRHTNIKPPQNSYMPIRSPQLTPKVQRLQLVSGVSKLGGSSTSLNVFPPNGHNFVAPPSPNFGYRPLESETSAVYTIIKSCINTNEIKEIHLLNAVPSATEPPGMKGKFEYAETTPPEIERKQRWLQCCTDTCSSIFLIPGLLITVCTPIVIIPMLLLPISYFIQLTLLFLASGALGVFILSFSGLLGNFVWFYDEKTGKLRLKLHCGRGPRLRFWGTGFYAWSDAKLLEQKENSYII